MDNGYWFGRSRKITDDTNCKLDFLPFHNEEEQIAVLNRLLDLVEQYGLKKLEEKAEESRAKINEMEELLYPTPEMYKKLYEEISEVNDPTFANEILGKGAAVIPWFKIH